MRQLCSTSSEEYGVHDECVAQAKFYNAGVANTLSIPEATHLNELQRWSNHCEGTQNG